MTAERQQIFLSNRIKELLNSHNMTQTEAAKKIGVSPQTFNTWVREIAMPRMDKLEKLADMFGVPTSYFIDDQDRERVDFLAAELSVIDAVKLALSKDVYIRDYDFSDEELLQIVNYARFIKEQGAK